MKDKEFYTLDEAAQYIGVKRATLYNYMKGLKIETVPMGPDGRKRFLALTDVKKMKAYKEQPWTVEVKSND